MVGTSQNEADPRLPTDTWSDKRDHSQETERRRLTISRGAGRGGEGSAGRGPLLRAGLPAARPSPQPATPAGEHVGAEGTATRTDHRVFVRSDAPICVTPYFLSSVFDFPLWFYELLLHLLSHSV